MMAFGVGRRIRRYRLERDPAGNFARVLGGGAAQAKINLVILHGAEAGFAHMKIAKRGHMACVVAISVWANHARSATRPNAVRLSVTCR